MERFKSIQALRGGAAIAVLISHLLISEQKYGGVSTMLPEIFRFGVFGVDIFFVVSGFIMVSVSRGRFSDSGYPKRFLLQRLARIYPLYWFYSSLVLAVYLLYPHWVNSSQGSQVDVVTSFLLFPTETMPLLAVGWTLIHEVYFYLVFFVILLFFTEARLYQALGFWFVAVVLLNILLGEDGGPILAIISHPLTVEFIIGAFIALLYFDGKSQINVKAMALITVAALSASLWSFSSEFGATGVTPMGWKRLMIFGTPAVCIVYLFVLMEKAGWAVNRVFVVMGDASYSIYLSHILCLSFAGRVWSLMKTDSVVDNYFAVPAMLVFACAAGVLAYYWIEVPLIRQTRRVTARFVKS